MSSRQSVIAIGFLVGTVVVSGLFFRKRKADAQKQTAQENLAEAPGVYEDEEFFYPYDCCITEIEECKDTAEIFRRMYYTDCGICFYSDELHQIGDTVHICIQ